ncbi:hypothetical protein [Ruegeria jejuensis]|uniref:hypothetical protein n=1 Tax=Ruegeria jejuensis TaxID=3233338 RepID=UPI00355C76E5
MQLAKTKSKLWKLYLIAIGFVFAASLALHFWIGDVVAGHKMIASQNYVLLRGSPQYVVSQETSELWVPISAVTYALYQALRWVMLSICSAAALFLLLWWLLTPSPSNRS